MGLASALSTALTGLAAAETVIDVAGNNVANSNTVGFKASEAVFATQFLQTQGLGSAPSGNRGGTNPRQVGLGTKVAEITPDFTQGTIEISSSPSDLAIQGDGFFIVQGTQGETLYTRNGIFKTNSENQLVTITGQRLLGFGVDENFVLQSTTLVPLDIPLGATAVSQTTENVYLEGTLPPFGANNPLADTPEIIASGMLSDGQKEVPPDLTAGDITAVAIPTVTGVTATPAAGGTLASGTYNYRVVLADADGNEGPPSAVTASGTVTGGPGQGTIDLAGLPTGSGAFTTTRIYRSDAAGAGPYTLAAELSSALTTYSDDGTTLGGALDTGSLPTGNFGYYLTYYNSSSGLESRPTSLIGPQSVSETGRRIRLENLPSPTGVTPESGQFDSIRIYRSLSSSDDTFYRVATLPAGTTSYIDGASDASIAIAGNELSLDGPAISFGLRLVDLVRRVDTTYENPFQEGTLHFTPEKGGRKLSTKSFEITSATTVQDLINFMEDTFGIVEDSGDVNNPIPGSPGGTIAGSQIQLTGNNGVDNALEIGLSAFQLETASGTTNVSLGFSSSQAAAGASAVTDFVVYDSLGIPLNVRLTAVLEASSGENTIYRWFADSPDNDPASGGEISVGTGTITFDGEGNFVGASNDTVSIDRRNVPSASPLEFDLNFDQISGLADQIGIAASRQDGSPPGTLTSFIIGEDGTIRGVFSNGVTRDLGQIRLARFANNAGLEQKGENLFAAGVNSGLPVAGNPGEQGIGTVIAGAVELSNTDIGQNLIDLILASTQYRGGTRVITAVQQLFDELLALRR